MCDFFCSSFVCIFAYANVYFKATIIKQNIKIILLQNNIHMSEVHCGSAVRFSQALLGYLITAHCLYAVIDSLTVWRRNKPKTRKPSEAV